MWSRRKRSEGAALRWDEKPRPTSTSPRHPSWLRRSYRIDPRAILTRVALVFVLGALARLVVTSDWAVDVADAWHARRHGLQGACPPELWARGNSREVLWHLAADREEQFDRFPNVASWWWEPSRRCSAVEASAQALVRHLVENGGWLLIGDSVTEGHFFSLSCMLYPHVRATPDYTKSKTFDRAWPQNLYLDPSSPLFSSLKLPEGFDVATTPLVTFRRVDLLLMPSRLDDLYWQLHPTSKYLHNRTTLFSDEPLWSLSPAEYVGMLTSPRPVGGYSTLIVSTGGHWTTGAFAALKDDWRSNHGIFNVVDFFREAMQVWAGEVQALLDGARGGSYHAPSDATEQARLAPGGRRVSRRPKPRGAWQVLVRAYVPGHDSCHSKRHPVWRHTKGMSASYNWPQIADFNRAFSDVLSGGDYPDIHYLGIDGPAVLRPDTHVAGDCLHFMTGSGVVEGWTQYIWHYVTVEIPDLVRSGR
ncbi:uncharacterized protein BXZ73DRAFT_98334 [Epithele typhae]|uniref:uncharacterized protein n=1 Tax=Epithele typhae TaxID=378194 RepID=UPI00200845D9|nr:uncharacterized protein BXZ73DRAFT_98334 [Epithele typhae]KAH9941122.1 hypothetical protein BXZ73DRAFT_98334 [Epithele typhae]